MRPTRRPSSLVGLFAVALMPMLSAQGPVYREQWSCLHLEHRRAELCAALRTLPGDRLAGGVEAFAELLAVPDRGVPFVPVANALARAAGREADDAFVLRSAIGLYVLPEVVDPESTVEQCRNANFTAFLPYHLPLPGAVHFELEVRDEAGLVVWQQELRKDTALEDLRMARPTASMPTAELPDGAYRVELRTCLDGAPPRDGDPRLSWRFHVLRGYQARCESAMREALAARDALEPLPRALLDGMALPVSRAYTGEAFVVASDAVQELLRLEQALGNLKDGRAAIDGMRGFVTTALPAGELVQPCVVRLPAGEPERARPLVVVAGGAPAYDTGARRPTAPATRAAAWLASELESFGSAAGWNLAVLDSPGGGRDYTRQIVASLEALPSLLPTGGRKPLLVCDREAAAIAALRVADLAPLVSGLVLVGAGAMPAPAIDALDGLPVRYVELAGYPASASIARMLEYVEAQRARGVGIDVSMLHGRKLPWTCGVTLSLTELEAFVADVMRRE